MSDKPFTERRCSKCGKINWDSETGNYRENCQIPQGGYWVENGKCDTNGAVIVDGVTQ